MALSKSSSESRTTPRIAVIGDSGQLLTLPALAREYGIGVKTIRREAKRGSFPVYSVGTCRLRVRRHEFERWVRSTRAPVSRHAARRLKEVLERERGGRTSRRATRCVDEIAR